MQQEHWETHNSLVKLKYYDRYVAIYFDPEVEPTIKWLNKFSSRSWEFITNKFGYLGGRLYLIFHAGKHAGGEPATYLETLKDNRSVCDSGILTKDAWVEEDDNARNIILKQTGYIVECK